MSNSSGVRSRNDSFSATIKRLSMTQLAFVLIAAIVSYSQKDTGFALALLFGGLISLAGTWVHAWRVHLATEAADEGLGIDSSELIKGSVLKFIIVIALFVLGMAVIKLEPLAIVSGFVIAQMSFLFTRGYAARRKPAQRG
ncbi:MAG: ATP synthase subunit I [Gammaproteobacteria bacterium]|nr:ATP synthase subunit I [Gammaproteobacteria bacterium]